MSLKSSFANSYNQDNYIGSPVVLLAVILLAVAVAHVSIVLLVVVPVHNGKLYYCQPNIACKVFKTVNKIFMVLQFSWSYNFHAYVRVKSTFLMYV